MDCSRRIDDVVLDDVVVVGSWLSTPAFVAALVGELAGVTPELSAKAAASRIRAALPPTASPLARRPPFIVGPQGRSARLLARGCTDSPEHLLG